MIKEIEAGYVTSPYFKNVYLYLSQNRLPSKVVIRQVETKPEKYLLLG